MTSKDDLVLLTGVDALAKAFGQANKTLKAKAREDMAVTERRPVELPLDGQRVRVASVTYVKGGEPKDRAIVSDPAVFLQWVLENHPEAIHMSVAEWFTAETLKTAEANGIAVDGNGEQIPGVAVERKDGSDPYIKVIHERSQEAKAALFEAMFENNAAGLRQCVAALELEAGES